MTLRSMILVAGALLAASTLTAQMIPPPAASGPRVVRATGEGEIRVVPDEAVFVFGIETSDNDISKARAENDRRVKDLLALADRLGIARKDVQTDYLSIEPRYEYTGDGRTRQFLGYFTRRNVTITLKSLAKFEELLTEALKLGVNYVGQAQFGTSELIQRKGEARKAAVLAARSKAEALAGALGASLGRVLVIEEEPMPVAFPMNQRTANVAYDMGEGKQSGDVLAPGQIIVSARVVVTFEIN